MEHARVIAKNSQCGQCDDGNRHGELVLEDILGDSGALRVRNAPAKGTIMVTHKESVMPDRDKWAGRFMGPKPDSVMKLSTI
mgnify:CR=1 FL=1